MSSVRYPPLVFPCWRSLEAACYCNIHGLLILPPCKRKVSASAVPFAQNSQGKLLVVVGGGAAGIYGAIRAKTVAPGLNVVVYEKGALLSKVKISGGGRCNVTNGHFVDKMALAEHYPRGNKELRGSFFDLHGPEDTMSWFSDHGLKLKVEDDGRVFPVSNTSSSIIDCLLLEAKRRGVLLQTAKASTASLTDISGKFLLEIVKRGHGVEYVEADYLLIATGSSQQGYSIATQLGHSIIDPVPSLFTFKINDPALLELPGVSFPKVKAKLKLEIVQRNVPGHTQVGPMLVTHWGLSGPLVLRLSAWGALELSCSGYKGTLSVDFIPQIHIEDAKSMLKKQKYQFAKQKLLNSCSPEFGLVKRFWKYILDREGLGGDTMLASVSNKALFSVISLLKQCSFEIAGKGPFKEEFVTAGGVPLTEISLNTMESKIQRRLFFAGEVLNVDGETGGFNFQNAWTGGFIAGTSIGRLSLGFNPEEDLQSA